MEAKTITSVILFLVTVACATFSVVVNRKTLKKLDDNIEKLKKLKQRE
jgi:hypothetical protein